jgi:hypothetical protein
MLPLHLWDAVLAHCTVQALHVFRQWNTESAERQLQLRFPNLTLAHILKHTCATTSNLVDCPEVDMLVDCCERFWHIQNYTTAPLSKSPWDTGLQLWSLQHDCALDSLHGNSILIHNGFIDDDFLLLIVNVDPAFYIKFWDFQSVIQTYTLHISENMYRELTARGYHQMALLVAPNRQAVWFSDTFSKGFVIQCNGNITSFLVHRGTIMAWKENQLYMDGELIYTLT